MSDAELTDNSAEIPILSLELDDIDKLYRAYMPYVNNGALFVKTAHAFKLGDDVFLSLRLLDEKAPHRLQGKVIWLTTQPSGTHPQGVGVQLAGQEGQVVQDKIRVELRDKLGSKII